MIRFQLHNRQHSRLRVFLHLMFVGLLLVAAADVAMGLSGPVLQFETSGHDSENRVALPTPSLTSEQGLLKVEAGSTLESVERLTVQRNQCIGLALGGGVLLLSVLFAYLKLEHATRGFYSGRMQSFAVILAIAVVCLFYYLCVTLVSA